MDPECERPHYQRAGVKVPSPSLAFLETTLAEMLGCLVASLGRVEIYAHHLVFASMGVGGAEVFL